MNLDDFPQSHEDPEVMTRIGAQDFKDIMGDEFADEVLVMAKSLTPFPKLELVLLLSVRRLKQELDAIRDDVRPPVT